MAWTLHSLVWITVFQVTASAYKCKHADSDSRPHYDYASHDSLGIPDDLAHDRMNTRSAEISPAYTSNVPDDVKSAQLRIAQHNAQPTQTRTENESKVLSWKPYAESRIGSNNDKIVFPGPTSTTSEDFRLDIPDHCKKLGFCDDVPNYPTEQAKKVIAELSNKGMFQADKLDLPDVPDITQRVGPQEENIELCEFEEKVVFPKAAVDASGKWHVVLNQDVNPVQGFKVEICKDVSTTDGQSSALEIREGDWQNLTPCSGIAMFASGYQGRCKQKFVYRNMSVLLADGTNLEKSLKVPSCCSCVARLIIS